MFIFFFKDFPTLQYTVPISVCLLFQHSDSQFETGSKLSVCVGGEKGRRGGGVLNHLGVDGSERAEGGAARRWRPGGPPPSAAEEEAMGWEATFYLSF